MYVVWILSFKFYFYYLLFEVLVMVRDRVQGYIQGKIFSDFVSFDLVLLVNKCGVVEIIQEFNKFVFNFQFFYLRVMRLWVNCLIIEY